jgi:hypothetical protein
MMRILMLTALLLTGCGSNPIVNVNDALSKQFTYDKADDTLTWCIVPLGSESTGSCGDWAATVNHHVGGEVHYVMTEDSRPHAIACKDGLCSDNMIGLFWLDESPYEYVLTYPDSVIEKFRQRCREGTRTDG